MELPLAYYGDAILRKKCNSIEEVTDEVRQLAADMIETMHARRGIGLAAPQVHRDLRIFVTQVPIETDEEEWIDGEIKVFINPKIVQYSEETHIDSEGCLSIPKLTGHVERPWKITIRALNLEGEEFEETLEGLDARCCLHENDHINGVLFIDRLDNEEKKILEPKLRRLKKELKNRCL